MGAWDGDWVAQKMFDDGGFRWRPPAAVNQHLDVRRKMRGSLEKRKRREASVRLNDVKNNMKFVLQCFHFLLMMTCSYHPGCDGSGDGEKVIIYYHVDLSDAAEFEYWCHKWYVEVEA